MSSLTSAQAALPPLRAAVYAGALSTLRTARPPRLSFYSPAAPPPAGDASAPAKLAALKLLITEFPSQCSPDSSAAPSAAEVALTRAFFFLFLRLLRAPSRLLASRSPPLRAAQATSSSSPLCFP